MALRIGFFSTFEYRMKTLLQLPCPLPLYCPLLPITLFMVHNNNVTIIYIQWSFKGFFLRTFDLRMKTTLRRSCFLTCLFQVSVQRHNYFANSFIDFVHLSCALVLSVVRLFFSSLLWHIASIIWSIWFMCFIGHQRLSLLNCGS